jgi:hypothetical protein
MLFVLKKQKKQKKMKRKKNKKIRQEKNQAFLMDFFMSTEFVLLALFVFILFFWDVYLIKSEYVVYVIMEGILCFLILCLLFVARGFLLVAKMSQNNSYYYKQKVAKRNIIASVFSIFFFILFFLKEYINGIF